MLQKFKDSSRFPLMLAKGLIVHKQVKDIRIIRLAEPVSKFVSSKWPCRRLTVSKSKSNIVTQAIVLHQKLGNSCTGGLIYEVRAAPTKHRIPPLRQNGSISNTVSPNR